MFRNARVSWEVPGSFAISARASACRYAACREHRVDLQIMIAGVRRPGPRIMDRRLEPAQGQVNARQRLGSRESLYLLWAEFKSVPAPKICFGHIRVRHLLGGRRRDHLPIPGNLACLGKITEPPPNPREHESFTCFTMTGRRYRAIARLMSETLLLNSHRKFTYLLLGSWSLH